MTITVFVGDNDEIIATKAKEYDSNAYLLHTKNFEEFLRLDPESNVTVYTALSDLPKITTERAVIYEVLTKADNIYYIEPNQWSDDIGSFQLVGQKYLTEFFLYMSHREKHNVKNLILDAYIDNNYIKLKDYRKSDTPNLFVAGCSCTAGVGVDNHEKFSSLISKEINMPLVNLAKEGSSIEFAADQILRSDVREHDIIIWGLTQEMRFVKWENNQAIGGNWTSKEHLFDETHLYKSIISVHQVVNFCRKVGAKLILLPLISTERLRLLLSNIDEYYERPYQTKPIDYGTDHIHAGPKQHRNIADFCLNIINKEK